jgi:hypothetical protein
MEDNEMMTINKRLNNIVGFAILVSLTLIPITAGGESQIVASGKFEGRSNHDVSGGVSVLKTESGSQVILEKDFSLDSAPDPRLGFGNNGYQAASQFSPLKSKTGEQVYVLPPTMNPASYNEVWVWCEKFNVPLGVARLN